MNRADGGQNIRLKHSNIADFTWKGKSPMETAEARKERTGLSSNDMTDAESQAVQKTPYRITIQSIRDAIKSVSYWNPPEAPHMTICVATMANGYYLVGKSTPADPENFDEQLGRKFALEDAERQAWPLMAFALREKMSRTPCMVIPVDEAEEYATNHAALNPDDA